MTPRQHVWRLLLVAGQYRATCRCHWWQPITSDRQMAATR